MIVGRCAATQGRHVLSRQVGFAGDENFKGSVQE